VPTLDDRLDDLASTLDELAQMIRNRNREDMTPRSETWDALRSEILRTSAEMWKALGAMTGEEVRWPLQN
jgi:hypothetical protein